MEQTLENYNPEFSPQKKSFAKRVLNTISSNYGWFFVLPAVILMIVFTFYPIINSLILAFKDNYNALGGKFDGWGIENFQKVLTGNIAAANFVDCLVNTLLFAVFSVPISTFLALIISVALNSIKTLQKLYQTLFFLPYLTSALAMGAVFASMFNVVEASAGKAETIGLFNNFLSWFGVSPVNWINVHALGQPFNPWAGRFVIILYSIWSGLPFKILILFSALQGVNKQYYDAAKIDGASKSKTLWKVTVPLISPMISYLIVTGMIGGLKVYTSIVGIFGNNMGPNDDYEMGTAVGFIYACIEKGTLGYAAAGSLILFAIIMVFTGINMWVSKKKVHY